MFYICKISFPAPKLKCQECIKSSLQVLVCLNERREKLLLHWWDNDSFCSLFFHFSCAQVTVATLKRKPTDHIWLNTIFKVCHWTVDRSVYVLLIFFLFICLKSIICYSDMRQGVLWSWMFLPAQCFAYSRPKYLLHYCMAIWILEILSTSTKLYSHQWKGSFMFATGKMFAV